MNINRAFISGTVIAPPVLRTKKNGIAATNILVQVTEKIYNRTKDDYFKRTVDLDCCAFGRVAETLCDTVKSGDHITILGPIQKSTRMIDDDEVVNWQIQILDFDLS